MVTACNNHVVIKVHVSFGLNEGNEDNKGLRLTITGSKKTKNDSGAKLEIKYG